MALPWDKLLSDVGPGGRIVTGMKGANALAESSLKNRYQQLINQYYGPNIESEINNRNALTEGQNIHNKYLPEEYRIANNLNQQKFEWNPRNWQSENANRDALTRGYDIANKYEPDKLRLANQKAQMEYIKEKQFQDSFNAAINQNRQVNINPINQNIPMNQNVPMNNYTPINQNPINQNPMNQYTPINQNVLGNINPQNNISQPPVYNGSQQANPNEQIISQGSPQLQAIDEMYENNPAYRPLLEKKGFKKLQQIKIDKSGKATLITKYPSGKIIVQSEGVNGEEGAPLTNQEITRHQKIVSSVDTVIPVLDKIIALKDSEYSNFGGWSNKGAKYRRLVKQALDSSIGVFGMPNTDKGLQSVLDLVTIGVNESAAQYRQQIKDLKEDYLTRQKYSKGLLKKSKTNSENDKESDPYDLDKYDNQGE